MIKFSRIHSFSFIASICILFFSCSLMHFFIVEHVIKKSSQRNASFLSSLIIKKIWRAHPELSEILVSNNLTELSKNKDYLNIMLETLDLAENYYIIDLSIYNMSGEKLLTTSDEESIKKIDHSGNYLKDFFISNYFFFAKIFKDYDFKDNVEITMPALFQTTSHYIDVGDLAKCSIAITAAKIDPEASKNEIVAKFDISLEITQLMDEVRLVIIKCFILGLIIILIIYSMSMLSQFKLKNMLDKLNKENLDLIKAREKAENENNQKSEFLANVTHELRTPLNSIIGFSDILRTESLGPIENKAYLDYLNDINISGLHLLSLINDILDFSKATADKLQVDMIEIDVKKIIGSCQRLVQPKADEAHIALEKTLPDSNIIISADPKRIKQAILNLLSNSIKFTPPGGIINITVEKNLNNLVIKIQDNGIGIDSRDIAKAMSTFGQVDGKLNRKFQGTGIGLPFTKKLVELMKGQFKLESELGVGTTVSLIFPYDGK